MTDNAGSRRVAMTVAEMPSWKKRLLMLTLTAGLVGGGAKVATMFTERSTDRAATTQNIAVMPAPANADGSQPGNSSGFVAGQSTGAAPMNADGTQPVTGTAEPEPSRTATVSTWVAKVGISVFIGLVVGTIFRMFVKTMAVISAVAIAAIVALSYFKVINIDFTTMKENYDTFAGWAQGQVGKLKDVTLAYLPAASSGVVGFVLGLKK